LEVVRRWLLAMKLTLNETNTCIRDARKEHFRFLGYELGPLVHTQTGRRYLGARPSKKALGQIREKVSRTLWRGRTERWEEIRDELNRKLRGWANYFAHGTAWPTFKTVDMHVTDRARYLLRTRHRLQARTARFDYAELHGPCGIVEVRRLLLKTNACA
jgi:RNA-directed DNA polymerase